LWLSQIFITGSLLNVNKIKFFCFLFVIFK
jgi:hypothetical protein